MLYLSKTRLEALLKAKGLNISKLTKLIGASRQSIYNMFGKDTVFNSTFEKMIVKLGLDYHEITEERDSRSIILEDFPDKIKKITVRLLEFAEASHADLVLFGSRAAGKTGVAHDFDFAFYFHKKADDKGLRTLKRDLSEASFPYRIDAVNLNSAPDWFKRSIENDMIYLRKEGG